MHISGYGQLSTSLGGQFNITAVFSKFSFISWTNNDSAKYVQATLLSALQSLSILTSWKLYEVSLFYRRGN